MDRYLIKYVVREFIKLMVVAVGTGVAVGVALAAIYWTMAPL